MDVLEILEIGLPLTLRNLESSDLLLTLSRQFPGKVKAADIFALEAVSLIEDEQQREAEVKKVLTNIGLRSTTATASKTDSQNVVAETKRIIF